MMRYLLTLSLALIAALPVPAKAADPLADALEVRILPGWRAADGQHVAALEVRLKDGWKTYWRAPGDAGVPPRFDWRGSRNLAGVEITWPTPEPFDQGGVRTIGYSGRMVLPLSLTPKRAGGPIHVTGQIDLGVCKDVCVPLTLTVSQDLPVARAKPDPAIVAALAARPYSASEAGVTRVFCDIVPMQDGLRLRAVMDLPRTGRQEIAVIETDNPKIWVAQGETRREGGRLIAETELYHVDGQAFAVKRSGLRITVLGSGHAVDIQGCPAG